MSVTLPVRVTYIFIDGQTRIRNLLMVTNAEMQQISRQTNIK